MNLSFHKKAFLYGTYLSFILFALAFAGVVVESPQYLYLLNIILKYYVCVFLLVRFNPIVEIKTRDPEFERRVAFSAAVFLFVTTTLTTLAEQHIELPLFFDELNPHRRILATSTSIEDPYAGTRSS
jgi:hypothetical protein